MTRTPCHAAAAQMKLIEIDEQFNQSAASLLRHQIADHPLLSTESLMSLALRTDPEFVRFHDGERAVGTYMGNMFTTDPDRRRLQKAFDNLEKTRSFVQVLNVYSDPQFRAFLDEIFAQLLPSLPSRDRRLVNRDAAAFLASPKSTTPFHLDHDQNFLCHIRGPKTFYVWDQRDRSVVSEQVLEEFYRRGRLRKGVYRPELQEKAMSFELRPGDCIFMPMGTPHAATTGDGVTVSLSVLMNTRSSYETVETYRVNYELRRLGMSPRPVGVSDFSDALKHHAASTIRYVRSLAHGRSPQRRLQWY
jgi:Cupin-like domain